jgi:hypothetical protein
LWLDVRGSVRELALASLALLALSACAGDESPDPAPDAVEVPVRQIYDMSQGGYMEGSYSYVRVESLAGEKVIEKRFLEGEKLGPLRFLSTTTVRLAPGSYRLVSFQRPCSGNCGLLDPPTDKCSREMVVAPDRSVEATITVRPGEGCSVEVEWQ